ncbi:ATP-binding protein [Nitrospina watsonii]|uniref:DNA replication protein-like protein n=1 Tax=Nitrospina watsonii TaxID=1323948 RepID=A0ABN8W6A9_9BACT|nr:ATP-binding protein [Nitrospina watsonii]CAI2719710.1 DNA replication protein-like protein [Nitrospina watsonii]
MTRSRTQPEKNCKDCRGQHYVLKNPAGRVQAEICACFQCEICGGRGQVFAEDETGVSFMRACECAGLKKRLDSFNNANLPGKYLETQFDTYHPIGSQANKLALKTARDFVKDFEQKPQSGLLFMGTPGVGKTHLAVSILKALLLEKGVNGKFIDFFQLLSDIRHGYSQDLSEQAIINPFVHAPVLVIDELAKGRNTEWELTMLDQIISNRYNAADKVTIFTTNYTDEVSEPGHKKKSKDTHVEFSRNDASRSWAGEETLEDKVGDRIFSRLAEMCRFVKMEGDDFRRSMAGKSSPRSSGPGKKH